MKVEKWHNVSINDKGELVSSLPLETLTTEPIMFKIASVSTKLVQKTLIITGGPT